MHKIYSQIKGFKLFNFIGQCTPTPGVTNLDVEQTDVYCEKTAHCDFNYGNGDNQSVDGGGEVDNKNFFFLM